jgi:hypothetical protein
MINLIETLTAMLQDPFFVAAYNLFNVLFALPGMTLSLILSLVFGF